MKFWKRRGQARSVRENCCSFCRYRCNYRHFAASIGWLAGNIRQGLDLQGGTHIIMQAEDTEQNKVTTESIVQVINIMQKRVNEMGLTEPIIQREGANRIIIELPGKGIRRKLSKLSEKQLFLNLEMKRGMFVLPGKT